MFAAVCEVVPPTRARSMVLVKGSLRLQLLEWTRPEPTALARNVVGITHLAFMVTDVDAVAERLVALGGTLLEDTRTRFGVPAGSGRVVVVADPDGVRVELARQPGAA